MEVINTKDRIASGKRCYFPAKLKDTCPECGEVVEYDFSGDSYLTYQEFNSPFCHNFYCGECDHEWKSEPIILNVELREWHIVKMNWVITFEENGGEYHGIMKINAKLVEKIDEYTIKVDGIEIELDKIITKIERV